MIGKILKKIRLTKIFYIVSAVLFCISVASTVVILVLSGMGDYGGGNAYFSRLESYGEIQTEEFKIDGCSELKFFSTGYNKELTLFRDEVPNLKIVNSDKYTIEVRTTKDLMDKLEVVANDGVAVVAFKYSYYGEVITETGEYQGMYVDCDVFDVTVYAPITVLSSDAEINLEYDTPAADMIRVTMAGEARECKIYNVNAKNFVGTFCGDSDVEISGTVSNYAQFTAKHSSAVDVTQLDLRRVYTAVGCKIFGLSYIKGNGFSDYPFIDVGLILTVIVFFCAIVGAAGFIVFFVMHKKYGKLYLETRERLLEEKNHKMLKIDENLLQNNE